jgi:hypothetical protein
MVSSSEKSAQGRLSNRCDKEHNETPPYPTSHIPGTEEKIRVLEERFSLGVSLWHPLDGVDLS